MNPIRTAIIGYGRSGSTLHAGAIEANPAFHLVAACDIDPERRQQARSRFDCTVYDDYHTMLKNEQLDLVCIVTRNDQHAAMACDCLATGLTTLVTKPWAANTTEAERMIAAAGKSGARLLPWLPARWGCDLKRLQQVLHDDAIGRVFLIRRIVSSFGTRNDWQTERRYAGGYLLNWGPHIVDPPCVLTGRNVKSVFGRLRQTINPGDVEDLFFAMLTLDDGTLIQTEYTISPEPLPTWFIQGEQGAIRIDGKQMKIVHNRPAQPGDPTRFATMQADGNHVTEETLEGSLYGDDHEVYQAIAETLTKQATYAAPPDAALQLTRILDAIRRSSDDNRIITL